MNIPETLRQGAIGLGCTLALAIGGAVIGSSRTNAVQDQQIATIQGHEKKLDGTLDQLSKDVQQLNVNVAVLNQRLADGKR